MSGEGLRSHYEPARRLRQHIAEVKEAARAILERQGALPWSEGWAEALAVDLGWLHDLGKASRAFQEYIADPEAWQGSQRRKAHTPLSLVLTAAVARREGWSAERAIAAALAVRGHHGGQPADGDRLWRDLEDDEMFACLEEQLGSIDAPALAEATRYEAMAEVLAEARDLYEMGELLAGWLAEVRRLELEEALAFRLRARAAYSVLLEADKTFLAVEKPRRHLTMAPVALPAERVERHAAALPATPLDGLRAEAAALAAAGLVAAGDAPILSLALPTGAGKTLVALHWALTERERELAAGRPAPLIVVALPMLSIVDQTERVYRTVLGAEATGGRTLLAAHSLADRSYDPELERGEAEFFVDTWRSEVVVTSFDQLLLALLSDAARHAMRFHRLLHARIVIDEIQCIPPVLWAPLSAALHGLGKLGGTRVLAMSATPPRCLQGAVDVIAEPRVLYERLDRYRIVLRHEEALPLDAWAEALGETLAAAVRRGENTLVTLNKRASAQWAWERIAARLAAAGLERPLLLSGDLTPRHRLEVIRQAQGLVGGVVVSTQCVEAGVDLDMHHVVRDFAPLDALVQIAGRCNRHALRPEVGTVTVVHLRNEAGRDDAADIYDAVLLGETRAVLRGRAELPEREVLGCCAEYFARLGASKYQGEMELEAWLRLRAALDVRRMLRGDARGEEAVLVLEQDPELETLIRAALAITDRWERRSTWRQLAGRLGAVTVTVSQAALARLATRSLGYWRVLAPGQYDPVRGLGGGSR